MMPDCHHDLSVEIAVFLRHHRAEIIEAWVNRLHTKTDSQYTQRPLEEIVGTVTEAFEANYHLLVHNNYAPIDAFIEKITQMRLAAGFSLSGVQKAFELFRTITIPMLAWNVSSAAACRGTMALNQCLAYTIHRFSDYFQEMHEKTIREHNLRLEMQVRERTAALIESERMATIGRITTSLSHEIRNPLSAVKMNLQILGKKLQVNGNDQRRLEISLGEVVRLENILKELLDFAKPLRIQHALCDINQVLASALELLLIKFEEKGVCIIKSFDPNMPLILADSEKLGQAFINLVLNALEASAPQSRVWVTSAYAPPFIEVCVKDESHGVAPDLAGLIFEPFFTTKSKGTGLGLSNTRRIIAAHGGKVDVTGADGAGASFTIFLPAAGRNRFEAA